MLELYSNDESVGAEDADSDFDMEEDAEEDEKKDQVAAETMVLPIRSSSKDPDKNSLQTSTKLNLIKAEHFTRSS